MIHNSSIISKKAKIGNNVKIGPFCNIGDFVQLDDNVELISNIHIEGNTTVGKATKIFPFASIGTAPQDLKYKNEPNRLNIGERNTIREYVTINPGTESGGGSTIIGNNCDIRQNVTFGGNFNKMNKEGRTQPLLEDSVSVGAGACILGPVTIGTRSIIGANSVVTRDVPPGKIAFGVPAKVIKDIWKEQSGRKL